jgi:curved DNA-binding protein CbpA
LDPYRILQVRSDAEDAVIAAAYRALARRYHPDVVGDLPARSMTEINAAWEILRDPVRRREYDRAAGVGSPPASAGNGHHATARAQATTTAQPHHARPAEPSHAWSPRSDVTGKPTHYPGGSAGAHPNGVGAAGPPPGHPSGSVLAFGRHIGWSIGEIARVDPGYLEWLEQKPQGWEYLEEIDAVLKRVGYRQAPEVRAGRRGWLRRS